MKINTISKSIRIYIELICIILVVILGANLQKYFKINNKELNILDKNVNTSEENIRLSNGKKYVSYKVLKENIDNTIYFDKVSNKIITTYNNNLVKAKINKANYYKNFKEINEKENAVMKIDNGIYILVSTLKDWYDLSVISDGNKTYIIENTYINGSIKNSGGVLKAKTSCKSLAICNLDKYEKIKIIIDKQNSKRISKILENDSSNEFIKVIVKDKYVGYVPRNTVKLKKEHIKTVLEKISEKNASEDKNVIAVYADINDNKALEIKSNIVNTIYVNMFDLIKANGEISVKNINTFGNVQKYDVYGVLTNGFNSVNFDKSTLSRLLSSEETREVTIKNLLNQAEINKLAGIVIDFKNMLNKDKNNFFQFLKEITAVFNANNKQVILNMSVSNYKEYIEAIEYTNKTIITTYDIRDTKSLSSGSTGEFIKTEKCVNDILSSRNDYNKKIILGLPLFSILWVEKNSKVIEAKTYSMIAIESYLEENKLTSKYDEKIKQNYVTLEKGHLVYRMWLEDETSIKNKLSYVKEKNLCGVAMYKNGYDNENIWIWLKDSIEK